MVQFVASERGDQNESAIDTSSTTDDSVHDENQQPLATHGDEKRTRKRKKQKRTKESSDGFLVNGSAHGSASRTRKNSLSKAARDPRDEPEKKARKKRKKTEAAEPETRSPSPVIDFDGLSRPSPSPCP